MFGIARGKTTDKRTVVGRLLILQGTYFICTDECEWNYQEGLYLLDDLEEVEKDSIAFATGKHDKNGEMIFGSVPDEGFNGGDSIVVPGDKYKVRWGYCSWLIEDYSDVGYCYPLKTYPFNYNEIPYWESEQIEIIKSNQPI